MTSFHLKNYNSLSFQKLIKTFQKSFSMTSILVHFPVLCYTAPTAVNYAKVLDFFGKS